MPPKAPSELDNLKKAALKIRALNHKLRYAMVEFIRSKGKVTVTEIYTKFQIEQTVTSNQLKILKEQNLVTGTRDGKYIYYSVNEDKVAELIGNAAKI